MRHRRRTSPARIPPSPRRRRTAPPVASHRPSASRSRRDNPAGQPARQPGAHDRKTAQQRQRREDRYQRASQGVDPTEQRDRREHRGDRQGGHGRTEQRITKLSRPGCRVDERAERSSCPRAPPPARRQEQPAASPTTVVHCGPVVRHVLHSPAMPNGIANSGGAMISSRERAAVDRMRAGDERFIDRPPVRSRHGVGNESDAERPADASVQLAPVVREGPHRRTQTSSWRRRPQGK